MKLSIVNRLLHSSALRLSDNVMLFRPLFNGRIMKSLRHVMIADDAVDHRHYHIGEQDEEKNNSPFAKILSHFLKVTESQQENQSAM